MPRTYLHTHYTRRVIFLAVSAAVGGFLFGFDSSVINGAVDSIGHHYALGSFTTGVVVAVALLGCAVGALGAGWLSQRFGRLKVMMLGAFLFLVSSVGTGLATNVIDMIVWRAVSGIGIGVASVVAPAYIAEIAPRQLRGRLGSLQQLAITLGIFGALLSDTLLAHVAGGSSQQLWLGLEAWRWMFLVGVIPSIVYGLLAFVLPESPRYLLTRGRRQEARQIFAKFVPPTQLEQTVNDITEAIEADRKNRHASLRGSTFGLKPVVWIGIILSIFQQFVGINVIFYYSTTLWKSVGFDESQALAVGVVSSLVNVAVTFIAIWLVDRLGRKIILLTGSLMMAAALSVMALCFAFAQSVDGVVTLPTPYGPIALVAANVFIVGFGASWGPLVWVLLGEIFPGHIRSKALGVAVAAQWIANFTVTVSFPVMSSWSLAGTYGMYALVAALSFLFVLRKIPETKGVELEQTEHLFVSNKP